MIEPFIEVNLLDNIDELLEFFEEFGYSKEDVYATVVSEDGGEFDGFAAEFHLFSDDELIAMTTSWGTKKEVINFVRDALGSDFPIE
jgi:hypothetical protein